MADDDNVSSLTLDHPRNKRHKNVIAHIVKKIMQIATFTVSNAFNSHRHPRRAAPVPDGKQEGGQHVFHDLVHQLVLNCSWYNRLMKQKMKTEGEGGKWSLSCDFWVRFMNPLKIPNKAVAEVPHAALKMTALEGPVVLKMSVDLFNADCL